MNIVLNIGGKTFVREENIGSFLTFYDDGVATYDYGQHHYGYTVEVVETTYTQIKMHLRTVTIQSIDYIEREYEEAIYNIAIIRSFTIFRMCVCLIRAICICSPWTEIMTEHISARLILKRNNKHFL